MIVTCERCATQFELDDSRVPPGGVRVRCSRCKHAFEIRLPEPGGAAEPGHEDEESDWQFNEDLPGSHPDAAAESGARGGTNVVDDLLDGATLQEPRAWESSGLDLADDGPPEPDPGPEAGGKPDAEPEFAAVDDLRGGTSAAAQDVLETHGEADASDLDLGPGRDADGDGGLRGEELAGDELGSPKDWDVLTGVEAASGDEADFGVCSSKGATPFDVDPDQLIDDRPRWRAWTARAGNGAAWALVAALFGYGLYAGLRPPPASASEPIAVGEGLELAELSGRWIDHLETGSIYVVSGQLHNARPGAASAPLLAVELLDDAGRIVAGPAPLLPPHSTRALRESSLERLESGDGRVRSGLRPGETRRFQAVFGPLANSATRIQVVESEPPVEMATAADPQPVAGGSDGSAAAGSPAPAASEPSAVSPPAAPAP